MMLTPLSQMLAESESVEIELSKIDPFPEHPFHVRADEDMERLIEKYPGVRRYGSCDPAETWRWKIPDGGRTQTVLCLQAA